jgi:membrane fusion protein (multidrug efflux system)
VEAGLLLLLAVLVAGTWLWTRDPGKAADLVAKRGIAAKESPRMEGRRTEGRPPAELPVPVGVDTVRLGTLVSTVKATGQTEAARRATIAARVTGRVATLAVEESATVGTGTVIVRLDAAEHALAVRQMEAELAEAQARYREMTLFDEDIVDADVRAQRARAVRARSGLARAEIQVERARLDLASTTLTAPFAGLVANVRVTAGETARAGEELMTVVDLDPIKVEVQVVERELQWLKEGNRAEIKLPAFPDTVFQGQIASINPVVDPETRTARVTVMMRNPAERILPGMFARVLLEGRAFENRILVPAAALVERDGRTLVFLLEPFAEGAPGDGIARWLYVTTGLSNEEFFEILPGEGTEVPEPGQLVITGGNYTLIHDARVRVTGAENP